MTQTLIADITIKKNPSLKNINNITVLNPLDSTLMINQIKQLQDGPIHIYDYTFNPKHKANETIIISDHINKTGHNPLIGNQNKTTKPFIDISNLYNTKHGVTTCCLGEYFNNYKEHYEYPSKYLCHISIIAKALGKKNINAFLINILDNTK